MKRNDVERHLVETNEPKPARRPAHHQWEDRPTIAPPFKIWGSFLIILVALLAWGILTGGA